MKNTVSSNGTLKTSRKGPKAVDGQDNDGTGSLQKESYLGEIVA